jgi:hypothetical protein
MKRIFRSLLVAALFAAGSASAAEPQLISKQSIATIYKSNGTVNNNAFGGGTGMANFFDGNLTSGVYIGPEGRTDNGSYIILDFTKDSTMPSGGWYLTSFAISSATTHKYSLYYSPDGSAWTGVEDGVGVSKAGTAVYDVNEVAKKAKIVFDEVGGWTASVAEIQIYGVDPAEVTCRHPNIPDWEPIQATANCTEYGIEQRQCPDCGEWFTRESATALPLGHSFESHLDASGTSLQFGSGSITCKRCDWTLDLSEGPVNLVTTVVDGTKIGRVPLPGQVNFTEVTVSSTGQEIYGVTPNHLINNNWTHAWNQYWFANSKSTAEYAQYEFGVTIDLTSVDISVPNRSHTLLFYSVEGDEETLVGEHAVEYDSSLGSGDNGYQRFNIEFRGVTLKTLRIKSDDGNNALDICELHPYGTVAGAGKSAAVRTRIIID